MSVIANESEARIPNPTAMVNPSTESLAELAAVDFANPIAMLNLLRFNGGPGRAAYTRYAQAAIETISAVGGRLIHHSHVVDPDAWDSMAVVYYPSTQAYITMQHDQRYVDAIPDRTAGLDARLLIPFALPPMGDEELNSLARRYSVGRTYATLVRSNDSIHFSGDPVDSFSATGIRMKSIGSGLVTDERWDELRLDLNSGNQDDSAWFGSEVEAFEVIVGEQVPVS